MNSREALWSLRDYARREGMIGVQCPGGGPSSIGTQTPCAVPLSLGASAMDRHCTPTSLAQAPDWARIGKMELKGCSRSDLYQQDEKEQPARHVSKRPLHSLSMPPPGLLVIRFVSTLLLFLSFRKRLGRVVVVRRPSHKTLVLHRGCPGRWYSINSRSTGTGAR